MRYPAVAGAFYERSRDALLREIKECYTHPLGPGRPAEVRAGPRRLVGLVVPHAGYVYSGPVAAHSYAALAADGAPQSFRVRPAAATAPAFGKGQDGKGMDKIPPPDPKHFAAKVAQDDISMCG